MAEEIINRVASSKLITLDLEDFYPEGNRVVFDIKDWLFKEIILKEKDFRAFVNDHNWNQYQGNYVALTCSSDAIIPSWAYLLITTKLAPFAKKIVVGNLETLETVIFENIINQLNIAIFKDKPVILKGCSNKPIPASAYTLLIQKLQPIAKSILFGEACSTVPLYKASK
ncbi:hypothetical protein KCTC32516_00702 [Polaribacter huanghezhanensis]|uniref:DUF2480 family protein n=1 Tax=Polaribacter huanghezhanensis TaxID=1354726 RepID=UPI002648A46B|nr:DUF2480 family protein [Polaribacter huanghezhanensis]WKD85362.1 hypothetical protein KCTC32516_00702 [Polaribacter huanghezhanensis]